MNEAQLLAIMAAIIYSGGNYGGNYKKAVDEALALLQKAEITTVEGMR